MAWKSTKTEGMTPIFILTTHCDVLSKSSALKCSEHKTADFDGTKFSRLSALTHLLRSVSFFGNLYNHKTSNNTPQLRIDCLWLVSPLIQETIFLFTIFRHVTPPPPYLNKTNNYLVYPGNFPFKMNISTRDQPPHLDPFNKQPAIPARDPYIYILDTEPIVRY